MALQIGPCVVQRASLCVEGVTMAEVVVAHCEEHQDEAMVVSTLGEGFGWCFDHLASMH